MQAGKRDQVEEMRARFYSGRVPFSLEARNGLADLVASSTDTDVRLVMK